MVSIKSLLVSSALAAVALAQGHALVAFTSVPGIAYIGQTYNITWSGGTGQPVSLTLREGNPANLASIAIIGDRITNNYYLWTVANNIPTASDYALQIIQGQSDINYSGFFTIIGTGTSSITGVGVTPLATATSSANGTVSATGNATNPIITASSMMNMTNSTAMNMTASSMMNSTASAMMNSSMASSMMSNMSSTAVAASTSSRPSSSSAAPASSSRAASSTAAAANTGGSTPNFPTATNPASGGAAQIGSSMAFVFMVVAAVMCSS